MATIPPSSGRHEPAPSLLGESKTGFLRLASREQRQVIDLTRKPTGTLERLVLRIKHFFNFFSSNEKTAIGLLQLKGGLEEKRAQTLVRNFHNSSEEELIREYNALEESEDTLAERQALLYRLRPLMKYRDEIMLPQDRREWVHKIIVSLITSGTTVENISRYLFGTKTPSSNDKAMVIRLRDEAFEEMFMRECNALRESEDTLAKLQALLHQHQGKTIPPQDRREWVHKIIVSLITSGATVEEITRCLFGTQIPSSNDKAMVIRLRDEAFAKVFQEKGLHLDLARRFDQLFAEPKRLKKGINWEAIPLDDSLRALLRSMRESRTPLRGVIQQIIGFAKTLFPTDGAKAHHAQKVLQAFEKYHPGQKRT